jgi:hypothetical protein
MRHSLLVASTILLSHGALAQVELTFDPLVPLIRNGNALPMGWAGGLNFPQVSDIDLNGDGLKDLFLFDRSGNQVVTLLNQGVAGQVSYAFTRAYSGVDPFNQLREWVLLRDYNGDGKEDIFTATLGGMAVWKNTRVGSELSFELVDTLVRSNYIPTDANMYVTQVDIPGIEDIDGDGDLDVITFSIFGNFVEYHQNQSMELYGHADSLVFEVHNRCWGFFSENLNNNTVTLNNPCQFNVPDPEYPLEIARLTAEDRAAHHRPTSGHEGDRAHTGSSSLPLDLDGDGDKDLILGDVIFPNLVALTNGGTPAYGNMVAQDSLFPVYDVPVDMQVFPAAYFEDVNNDGKRDLLVTPNYASLSENYESVFHYRNEGTDAAPVFAKQQENLFQDRMLDLGEGAYPVPFDLDGDGLMDLIVPNYGYFVPSGLYPCKMAALRNTGTATSPAFTLVDDDYMDLSTSGIGNAMHPAFGDMDGDGDKDMYVGDLQGRLHYYKNVSGGPVAQFNLEEPTVVNDASQIIDVGQFATPQLFDVDGDLLLDLLIGERNGNVNYYHNTGTSAAPVWHLENDSVGGVVVSEYWNVTGYSVPFMYTNNAGEHELVVGSESGWIHHYDNIDGNLGGVWNLVDSMWQDLREGMRTGVALYDLTGDGYLDAVVGNYRGGLSFWRNDFASATAPPGVVNSSQAFQLLPNPAQELTTVVLSMEPTADTRLELTDAQGRRVLSARFTGKPLQLPTHAMAPGIYLVNVTHSGQRWSQRLAVLGR